ncbi:MAG: efflux RND transporter periplasmic adaptor subunit [Thermodesulfobacteriota bacterium]
MSRTTKKQWFKFLLIVCVFLIFLLGLYLRLRSVRSDAAKTVSAEIPKPVKVISPVASENWLYRQVLGRVEGGQTINLRADVVGWVDVIYLKRDDDVKKGEIIVKLSDERKVVALKEAEFRLKASKANLKEIERKFRQNQTLFQKGIISRDNLDSNKNQLEVEKANMQSLEASYNRVKWNYDNLEIKSPIDGTVIDIIPDVGQEVFEGEQVAKVVNLSNKRLVAGVDASIARLVKTGSEVDLKSNSQGIIELGRGEIVGVSRNSDDDTGTYEIEIKVLTDDVNWWPGEIVAVNIPIKKLSNVIRVPRTAVLSGSNEVFIFVSQNGKSLKVPVEVTWVDDKTGLIPLEFVPQDSQIIIEGSSGLTNGQEVKIITE